VETGGFREFAAVVYGDSGLRILRDFTLDPFERGFPLHWHDRIELLRIHKGSMMIRVGQEPLRQVSEGDVVIICPRQPHTAVANETGIVYDVLMFELDSFYNHAGLVNAKLAPIKERQVVFSTVCQSPRLVQAIDKVVRLEQTSLLSTVGSVYELLDVLYQEAQPQPGPQRRTDARMSSVVDYIDAHYTEPITTAFLSEEFGYDESYFCRRFKKIVGISVMGYINIMRLEYGKRLLRQTGASVVQVAQKCGFSDAGYFSHRFTEYYGISPAQLRKMQKA